MGQSSPAFRKFVRKALAGDAYPDPLRLYPGESLLIDNGRMLHGRSALGGDKDRLLIRRWIASPFDTFGRASEPGSQRRRLNRHTQTHTHTP